jgi:predicted transcriptional regulator
MNEHRLPPETEERLQRLAEREQRSADQILAEAAGEYLDRRDARSRVRQEAAERSREMDDTGEYVAHEDAVDWLRRLANDENPPPPPVRR